MGILRKTSIEARPPSRAYLKAHYAEKAWRYQGECEMPTTTVAIGQIEGTLDSAVPVTMAANSVKATRMRASLTARAACLEDWERRLKHREKQLVESEDAFENIATLYTRRTGIVFRALRLQWGRETAAWFHHGAGLLLLVLIVTAVLTIAFHWQVRYWQCNEWQGMACWGVMGYTVIAGMSYICRIWIEERAVDARQTGAFVFACLLPFIHFMTCLAAALWSVGIGAMCHAK